MASFAGPTDASLLGGSGFYTATHELWDLERLARAAGVSLVVRKPADPKDILGAVASLVEASETG